jgi:hypothetical protein
MSNSKKIFDEKTVILEKEKYSKIDCQRRRQNKSFSQNAASFHEQAGNPGNRYRSQNQSQISRIPASVKKERTGKQEKPGKCIAPQAHGYKKVAGRGKRKKYQKFP